MKSQSKLLALSSLVLLLGVACADDNTGGDDDSMVDPGAPDAAPGASPDAGVTPPPPTGIPNGYPALPPGVLQHAVGTIGDLAVDLTAPNGASDGQGSLVIDVTGNGVEFAFSTIDIVFGDMTGGAAFQDANQVVWTSNKCNGGDLPDPDINLGQSPPYLFGYISGYVCNDQGLAQKVGVTVSFVR